MLTYEIKLQAASDKLSADELNAKREMIAARVKFLRKYCDKTGLYNLVHRYYGVKLHGTGAQVAGLVNAIIDAEYFGALSS